MFETRAPITNGRMFSLPEMPAEDGTYVARLYDDGVRLDQVTEPDGYEVAYDNLNLGVEVPAFFIKPGDRIGVWTDPSSGIKYLDRTAHVRGPEDIALTLAREFQQIAIWDWQGGYALQID